MKHDQIGQSSSHGKRWPVIQTGWPGRWLIRGAGCLVLAGLAGCGALTPAEEAELAAAQIEEINTELAVLHDPRIQDYLDSLTLSLQEASASNDLFQVHVVRNEAFNAFAIAGGHIYLTTGVILGSRNVAELASILSHEIAHVEARHIAENYRRFRNTRSSAEISGILLALLTGNPFLAGAADLTANLGSSLFITSHTREAEREADALAFQIMLDAGYDPRSQLTLLTRLLAASNGQELPAPFLLTHPLPADRVEASRVRLQSVASFNGLTVNDAGELQALQEYLAR